MIKVIQVRAGEALSDSSGSAKRYCKDLPMIPCASIIQNNMRDPINGVTIMGKRDTKIVGPFRIGVTRFTPNAIARPSRMTSGVTTNV